MIVTDTVTNGLSFPNNLLHKNNARFEANTVFLCIQHNTAI